jgi:hypothetical protein
VNAPREDSVTPEERSGPYPSFLADLPPLTSVPPGDRKAEQFCRDMLARVHRGLRDAQ